ncbi:hypothetical protein ACTWQL_01410 [Pseudalkalibacillus sp. R45]|uniref:hypothetical protein n=1 Tax=Pseudalkalibacillus sp. R45 TaxID=3457433 RepID=UPI003FCEA1E3
MKYIVGLSLISLMYLTGCSEPYADLEGEQLFDYWQSECDGEWGDENNPCSKKEVFEYIKRLKGKDYQQKVIKETNNEDFCWEMMC